MHPGFSRPFLFFKIALRSVLGAVTTLQPCTTHSPKSHGNKSIDLLGLVVVECLVVCGAWIGVGTKLVCLPLSEAFALSPPVLHGSQCAIPALLKYICLLTSARRAGIMCNRHRHVSVMAPTSKEECYHRYLHTCLSQPSPQHLGWQSTNQVMCVLVFDNCGHCSRALFATQPRYHCLCGNFCSLGVLVMPASWFPVHAVSRTHNIYFLAWWRRVFIVSDCMGCWWTRGQGVHHLRTDDEDTPPDPLRAFDVWKADENDE